MKKLIIYFLLTIALPAGISAQWTVGGTVGSDYQTIQAAFEAINNGSLDASGGAITLKIIANTTEPGTAILHPTGFSGFTDYSSVLIYPTASGYSITGSINMPLIEIYGAANITFDGRVNQSGAANLIITNTSIGSSASTIRFTESANLNTIEYCYIKGSGASATGGIILFSTSSAGGGNSNNTIDHNYITNSADANRPYNAIYSEGFTGYVNTGNTISNNYFYDFLNKGASSNGILLSSYTSSWTISNNSFYETASFAPTASVAYCPIQINNTSGNNFSVSGNFIGGRSGSCGGSAWTKTSAFDNAFSAIYLNVGSSGATNVQGNTIQNIAWSNSANASWKGIDVVAGAVNIGTTTLNTLGNTSTGSITVTGASSGLNVYGIYIASSNTVDCQNNKIGSFTAANDDANASNFYGIWKANGGTTTISGNTIGDASTANSINASSICNAAAQSVYGINNSGTGIITISSNTIANLTNGTTNATPSYNGVVNGIKSTSGTNTISNNSIHHLSIANSNTNSTSISSVCGIALLGSSLKDVTENTIYELSNSYDAFGGAVIGIFYVAANSGTNSVNKNFIHSLKVTGLNSYTAYIYGIRIASGLSTYSNNIISLGGTSQTTIYGIYESGTANNNNNLYYNTVYIGGDGNGGTNKSYALYSAVNTNTRDFRNNIFVNARSTSSGLNLHYAAYIVSTGGTISCDYNDYLASGTFGSTLGYFGANKTVLPIVTGQDISSFAINPSFTSAGGTDAANYIPSAATLVAITGTGITTDYDGGADRSTTYPSMGAFEYTVAPGAWTWTGTTSANWSTPANWNYNVVPPSSGSVIIANVANQAVVNEAPATPAQCQDLTINPSAILTIAAGSAMTVSGTLTNNGTLKLNSGPSAIASLKLGTYVDNGAEEIQLYLEGNSSMWHYISSPVTSLASSVFYYTGSGAAVTEYRENLINTDMNNGWVTSSGSHYNTAALPPNWESGSPTWSNLSVGYGYNYYSATSKTFTISGAINTADASVTLKYNSGGFTPNLTQQGYNLIGNPFTCGLDWDAVIANNSIWSNVESAIYFRVNGVTYSYANGHIQPNDFNPDPNGGVIPPMQGFFIKSNLNNVTLNIPASAKVHTANKRYKGESSSSSPLVRLQINNSGKMDQTLICLEDKATTSFDNLLDARKIFPSSDRPSISSSLEGIEYSINAIPLPESSFTIPLIINANTTGLLSIDATEILGLENYNVYLNDKLLNTTVNLSKIKTYSFSSVSGVSTDRFTITISNVLTAVPENKISNKPFNIYSSREQINIQTLSDDFIGNPGEVRILDLTGKAVSILTNIEFSKDEIKQVSTNGASGIYLVEIRVGQKRYVGKVIVR